MVRDEHADAPLPQKADDLLDFKHGDRVDARKRLIQKDKPGTSRERTRDFHPASLAARKADREAVLQMGDVQVAQQVIQTVRDVVGILVVQFEHRADIVRHGQAAEYGHLLWQIAQAKQCAAMDRHVGEPPPVEMELAPIHRHEPDHHVEAGRFTRAIGTQEADDLAAAHLQGHILDDGARAVALLEPLRFEFAHLQR